VSGRPELIVHGIDDPGALAPLIALADVVAVGPGLGQSSWSSALFEQALECGKPLVIDADALNLLARRGGAAPAHSVLTPHPGEAGRLLGSHAAAVQADRMAALQELLSRHPASVIVLKGAGTLIAAQAQVPAICERGNPAMAAPGMGDVLTGVLVGILAQCRDPWRAACAAVLAHALAGDDLARERSRGLLALELAEAMSRWVNP
jgi:NAD(P)H-hydrate epimerase